MNIYKGEVISQGIALGIIHKDDTKNEIKEALSVVKEKELFAAAIKLSLEQIEALKNKSAENKDYLDIQSLLINDSELESKTLKLIEQGFSASYSISTVLDESASALKNSTSSYLQQRVLDIEDIKSRILNNIQGENDVYLDEKFIYYAKEIYPSFLIQNKEHLLGIITNVGGYSSHTAILCRHLNLAYIVTEATFENGMNVIIDTRKQQIIENPNQRILKHYTSIISRLAKENFKAISHEGFGFYANVSDNLELDKVLDYGFDGIGLYRTEMIFMNTDRPYSYEEQYEIYLEAVEKMNGLPIYFRTFDIGDDKQISYIKTTQKGVDNYLNNPDLFETQIKAFIKANKFNNIGIMFPMINNNEEFKLLKNWVLRIQKELKDTSTLKIGMMLETKEAMEKINEFEDVDFISIGTNDLVLSIYHINRSLQHNQLKEYINDLVDKIANVVAVCETKNISLSICGELAAITLALKRFLKVGVKNFSVAAPAIKALNHECKKYL